MPSVAAFQSSPDRRAHPRLSAMRPGKLYMADGNTSEVVIVDLSDSGARVRLRRVVPVPAELVLADRHTLLAHRASVVWSRDGEVGLRFTRSLSLKGVVPGPLQAAKAWCLAGDGAKVIHI